MIQLVLRHLALIDFYLFRQKVNGVFSLQNGIAHIFWVCQYLEDGCALPSRVEERGDGVAVENFAYMVTAFARQRKHIEEPNDSCLSSSIRTSLPFW